MHNVLRTLLLCSLVALLSIPALSQPFGFQNMGPTFPTDDPIVKGIYKEAMESSQLPKLAHELLDVIGPRLVGSPSILKANDWAVAKYTSWGIEAKNEKYGEWRGWERGTAHIDLLQPRVRTLEGTMLSWSPATKKGGTTAGLIILADVPDSVAFQKWLPTVKGKFVLVSAPSPTGRPDKVWEEFGTKESFDSLKALRTRINDEWQKRIRRTGFRSDTLANILENAGAVGVVSSSWSSGWGVYRVFDTKNDKIPVVALSLEDYNLLYRLVEYGDNPIIRVETEGKFLGASPAFNTIGMIKGTEKPDEYVVLSAHLDSWEAGSGATDNGTGTLIMMETMRILKKFYPNPKRTIIVGHWDSEEQGLNGSKAFVKDHPEIIEKIQALFNQDNGTGRITSISASGFLVGSEHLARWIARSPDNLTRGITLGLPGMPGRGGTDHASFVAGGAPSFGLNSNAWEYFSYTWHTNRDTYDKLVFDDLETNVALTACLVYQACEDPTFVAREHRVLPNDRRTGKQQTWPEPVDAERTGGLKK
ncbi:MAG: M20/M25/M40 family metallo-hydrolase [Ignavibacteriales bacterium]|nr:M20/M25/M40 family metallo-hydrolase [Ignavibacteriales bacterium]